ncbi:ABC transporter substrate-binding protein [Atopomonas sediminilitoris]|uniref:ABC transporter substrate-binding protein n=1 Tax=Atopomonas sediminilitoris TaxID=2919919 RepID=UPI001F4D8719|nr:ABC transporter substrate-binding protein [Atopomonas sediminilitoris]MCJ8168266.1 ABC transporter substrate-binding protein [Atopomonas sediminilitoris]
MNWRQTLSAAGLALATSLSFSAHAATPECELDRPVRFAGMNWTSNLITVEVERFIMQHGYGCESRVETGGTLPMLAAIVRGDVDVMSEVWINSVSEAWEKGVAEGKVQSLGDIYTGGVEAWWIPRYVAERFPELKSVKDLPRFKQHFADPEDPDKGLLLTCPAGWACEVINTNLFKAYGLQDSFNLSSPGTGAALKAAITSAYKRKKNVAFYYWSPTPLLGQLDLVQLQMEPYNAEGHACNTKAECATPYAGSYPSATIKAGVNTEFANSAPQLLAFLEKVNIPTEKLNGLLAWAEEEGAESDEAARYFLSAHPELWQSWVPDDVAARVSQAL